MNYSEKFNDLIEKSFLNNQYIGLGNPNAKILFIGKEAGFDLGDETKKKMYNSNILTWKDKNDVYTKPFSPEQNSPLRNANHTWQKYQLLHNFIFPQRRPLKKYDINFVEKVFTTELSNIPSPKSSDAKKHSDFCKNLKFRKENFLSHTFFKKFPIVVIFAKDGEYIKNIGEGENREIDTIFDVAFTNEVNCGSKNNTFWVHHSKDTERSRMLIHTRQLTNGASLKSINKIGIEIKHFVAQNNIQI